MYLYALLFFIFFFKQKTAYEMRIRDWSSDVCSSDLAPVAPGSVGLLADGGELHPLLLPPGRGARRRADRLVLLLPVCLEIEQRFLCGHDDAPHRTTPSDGNVLGLRMMQHDRRGRLLRVELVLVGQHDADLRRLEQAQELLLVLQLRPGRVAEGVARAATALAAHGIEVTGVLVAAAALAPDPLVDILGQRLGDRKSQRPN